MKNSPYDPHFLHADVWIEQSVVDKLTADFCLKFLCLPTAFVWSRMETIQPAIFQLSTNTECYRTINIGIFMHT
jgi:hypothetical protein